MKKILVSILAIIYRISRKALVRRLIIKIVCKLEGGQFFSKTARMLLKKYEGIEIGIGTYGPCFDTANVTPGVTIGKYCSIAPGVSMYTRDHPYHYISTCPLFYNSKVGYIKEDKIPYGKLTIGNDVWIGRNTTILPSCHVIGNGAVIGAGSVVTHDIPSYAIAVGVPARVMKYRFEDEIIASVEKTKWWDWDVDELLGNNVVFSDPSEFLEYYKQKEQKND